MNLNVNGELLVMVFQGRFVNCIKCTTVVRETDGGECRVYMGMGVYGKISQFYCEPKTILKSNLLIFLAVLFNFTYLGECTIVKSVSQAKNTGNILDFFLSNTNKYPRALVHFQCVWNLSPSLTLYSSFSLSSLDY